MNKTLFIAFLLFLEHWVWEQVDDASFVYYERKK